MTDASQNGFEMPPAGWQALVNEVHARIDAVDAAMSNLRIAVRYLETNASRADVQQAIAVAKLDSAATSAQASADAAAAAAAEEAEQARIAAEQEAAREEVRRAVEAAKQDLNPYGFGSEVWAMPRDVWPGAAPSTPEPISTGDPTRDEVRRAVEEAKAQLATGELKAIAEPMRPEPIHPEPVHVEPARDEAVPSEPVADEALRVVEEVKAEMPPALDEPWKPVSPPSGDDARAEVRRAIEEVKAQIARGDVEKPSLADVFETISKPAESPEPVSPTAHESATIDSLWHDTASETPSRSTPDLVADMPLANWGASTPDVPASEWGMFGKPVADTSAARWDAPAASAPSWPSAPTWDTPVEPATETTMPAETPAPVEASAEAAPSAELDAEAQREAVRAAVERAKAEMQSGKPSNEMSDEEAAREEVRRAVAQMRNEINWTSSPMVSFDKPGDNGSTFGSASGGQSGFTADDPDGKRDEVRRMVEAARSQMGSIGSLSMYDETAPPEADGLKPDETRSLFAAFSGADNSSWIKEPDLSGLPASIVIEDPEGRVELARVYDTLNRVDRSTASLLNYTPHSVTVGLTPREPLPAPEVMVAAVRDAFGRGCKVTTEGVKMSVKIGEGEKAA